MEGEWARPGLYSKHEQLIKAALIISPSGEFPCLGEQLQQMNDQVSGLLILTTLRYHKGSTPGTKAEGNQSCETVSSKESLPRVLLFPHC